KQLVQKGNASPENWPTLLVVLGLNFLSFVVFSFLSFKLNESHLFYGMDGGYMMDLVREQMEWLPLQLGFSNNFLQSLGNVWFPLNAYLTPGYAVSILNGGQVDPALSYTIFSSELFLATLWLGIFLCVRPILAVAIAWALCLLSFPYIGFPALYPILHLTPQIASLVATGIFVLICFFMIGKTNAFISLVCAVAVLLMFFTLLLSLSVATILIAPILAVFVLFGLIYSESRYERLLKLLAGGLILAVITAFGGASFLYGLFKNTAATFFGEELFNNRMQITFTSLLFTSRNGFILVLLCLAGASILAFRGSGRSRVFAKATLFCMALILSAGVICESINVWHGPSPINFEFQLWPFYAVFAGVALGIFGIYGYEMVIVMLRIAKDNKGVSLIRSGSASFYGVALAIVPWWIIFVPALFGDHHDERSYPYPPFQTPIMTMLVNQISLKPGKIFRGRVGTFTGQGISGGTYWVALHALDTGFVNRFGNDHRTVGLWYYDIPTLTEYNPLITPAFYLITKYFLARSNDVQVRSVMALRKINPKILRALGVRFVITDAPIGNFAHLRERIPQYGRGHLFFYELDDPNIGQFSPHEAILGDSAAGILAAIAGPDFDPERDIVVEDLLPKNLSPLATSQITTEEAALRISASSSGASIMLLPLEYSHCLEVKPISHAESPPTLFRADLVLTGVLFDRKLDAVVSYFTGPFHNAACRLEDAGDMERLNATAASRS
ncbi:MAG TPA: hypothetical protein VEI95_12750, partial [Acidobacteriota bacterium]|nr:hypothetical protein [Acidobacteriota bacterium]